MQEASLVVIQDRLHLRQALVLGEDIVFILVKPYSAAQENPVCQIQAAVCLGHDSGACAEDRSPSVQQTGITVLSVVISLIGQGKSVSLRRFEFDNVISRRDTRKLITSVCVCERAAHTDRCFRIVQAHLYIGNSGFIRIPDSVMVCIIPDKTADLCRLIGIRDEHSCVQYLRIACGKADGITGTGEFVRITVRVFPALTFRGEHIARGECECQGIVSGFQT